jgi:hypothetical protein
MDGVGSRTPGSPGSCARGLSRGAGRGCPPAAIGRCRTTGGHPQAAAADVRGPRPSGMTPSICQALDHSTSPLPHARARTRVAANPGSVCIFRAPAGRAPNVRREKTRACRAGGLLVGTHRRHLTAVVPGTTRSRKQKPRTPHRVTSAAPPAPASSPADRFARQRAIMEERHSRPVDHDPPSG